MNNGLLGFPLGPNSSFKETIFTSSGTFVPMPKTKFVIVETQGAGASGGPGSTTQGGFGGSCGQYVYRIFSVDQIKPSCRVTIGATSASQNRLENTQTLERLLTANGGRQGNFVCTILGPVTDGAFGGSGGVQTGAAAGNPGKHGGFGAGGGAGGGGTDGVSISYAGGDGGKPRSFQFNTTTNLAQGGGGALGGQTAGAHASTAIIISGGFGEGGGGGAGNASGVGGNGSAGLNGGGGGGGGRGSTGGGGGGAGGTGIMKFLEVAYE